MCLSFSLTLTGCKSRDLDVLKSVISQISTQLEISKPEFSITQCNIDFCWDINMNNLFHIFVSSSTEIIFTILLWLVFHLFYSAIPSQSK